MVGQRASRLCAYEAAFRDAKYPGKAPALLARAFMEKCRATSLDPESEEVYEEFVRSIQGHMLYTSSPDEEAIVLDGLLWLAKIAADSPIPYWADPILKDLNWRHLYKTVDRVDYSGFFARAEERGWKPSSCERLRDLNRPNFDSLPKDLKSSVLDDEECRRIFREIIAAQPSESKPSCIAQVLRTTSNRVIQRFFCELIADDVGLREAERERALQEPAKLVDAAEWACRLHYQYGGTRVSTGTPALMQYGVRQKLDPTSTWDELNSVSDVELVQLVKQWSLILVRGLSEENAYNDPAPYGPVDVVRLYSPILRAVAKRNDNFFELLWREILSNPAAESQTGENWRSALLDLPNVVSHYFGWRLSPRRLATGDAAAAPSETDWREFWEASRPRFCATIRSVLKAQPSPLSQLAPWRDIIVGERRPVTGTAARIVDLAFQGLGDAGEWELVEELFRKVSGSAERHVRLHQSVKQTVIGAVGGEHAKRCEEFLIRLLRNPPSGEAYFAPDLAVSFALASSRKVDDDEVLSTPERAELNALSANFHQWSVAPAERVALARRLKQTHAILGALVEFFCNLSVDSAVRIPHGDSLAPSLDLGDLLFATGEIALNPERPCSWPRNDKHLVHWHLGLGHGIKEFFKDFCEPRHGKDLELHWWIAALAPDRVQMWMAEHLAEVDDARVVPLMRATLRRLEKVILFAHHPETFPNYKLHPDWKAFREEVDGYQFVELDLQRFPKRRIPILEEIYYRLNKLAGSTPDAWPLLANLAVMMADHPAYPGLVTDEVKKRLLETSKTILLNLRTAARSAAASDSGHVPGFYAALCVLCVFKDVSSALRQLLLIFREIPFASVPPSLEARRPPQEEIGWFVIPRTITLLLQNSAPEQREEIRHGLADYLQERLKPREPDVGREAAAREGEHAEMIEPNPVLREAYVEALADLRTDRGGRLHRLLGNVALEDPSPEVKEAARRCATRAKQAGKEPSRLSLGRIIMNAWWFIRRGTTIRFGEDKVSPGSADNTKVSEVTFLRGESTGD